MEDLLQDLRYLLRALARSPSHTGVVLFTLAVGIGANAAIFSIVNSVLLRPLPYRDPDRLVMLYQTRALAKQERLPQPFANYLDFERQSRVFDSLAAYYGVSLNLTGSGEPERLIGTMATASLFDVLGVPPHLGVPFPVEAEEPGRDPVVVISYGLWQRRFAGDPAVLGQTITLSEVPRRIVGVMPAGFRFPHKDAEFWVPLALEANRRQARNASSWLLVGRLDDDVSIEQARADVKGIAARLERDFPEALGWTGAEIVSLHEQVVGAVKPSLLLLMATVVLVLLIACVNIANLLLARAAAREKEIAIRLAVGAGRRRVIRQLLTESVVLALVGGLLGLMFAAAGLDLLLAYSPADLPRLDQVSLDAPVLLFTLGVSFLTGLVFGVAPAYQASKPDLLTALKEGGRGSLVGAGGRRLRGLMLVVEVALCCVLLIGAGLMVKSFARLQEVEPGFNPDRLVSMNIQLPRAMWVSPGQSEAFFKQLLERIESLPGVEATGAISAIFIGSQPGGSPFLIEGREPVSPPERVEAPVDVVTPGYFRAMGIRLLEGREFTAADHSGAEPVTVINRTFARRFWPGESALGKRIKFGAADASGPWVTVVGVVDDMRRTGLDEPVRCEAFWPHAQRSMGFMSVVTRAAGDPGDLIPALHAAVWSLNGEQPISHTQTLETMLEEMRAARRFNTLLFGLFAAIAVVLAAAGIYGVMSYTVARRRHEIGVRMALGAKRGDILRQFVGEGMRLTAAGLALGILGAYGVTRWLSSLLFAVSETDPSTFVVIPFLLTVVALFASLLPALSATKIDPLEALREE